VTDWQAGQHFNGFEVWDETGPEPRQREVLEKLGRSLHARDEPAVEDLSRPIAARSRGRDGIGDGQREGIGDRHLLEAIEAAGRATMAGPHVGA